jgi:hypothetical protein
MKAAGKISLLAMFFATCIGAAMGTAWVRMRADEDVKPAELYAVVQRQLGNFRGGNFPGAYEDASRMIQARYNVDQFAAMVQANYPGMTRIDHAEYGIVQTRGRHATMQVFLIGEHGEIIPCIYIMVREGDSWRIDGTQLMRPWPRNARPDWTMI